MLDSVDLQLATSCSLSGFVRDADGKAVAGATVFVRDSRGECLARMSSCKSDERGEYTYAGLAPGSYTVSARAGARAARETASIAVREDASARMDLTLEAGTMLRVATSDKGDKAVRAGVSVTNEQGLEVGDLQTSEGFQELMADGWSTSDQKLGPLPPGKYVVTATTPSGKSTKQSVTLSGESELAIKLRVE